MSEVKKVSLGKVSYPQARTTRSIQITRRRRRVKNQTPKLQSTRQDTFQSSHYDSGVNDIKELRRRSLSQSSGKQGTSNWGKDDYPKATGHKGSLDTNVWKPESGNTGMVESDYPRAEGHKGVKTRRTVGKVPGAVQNSNSRSHSNSTPQTASAHSNGPSKRGGFKPRYRDANTITNAKRKKFNWDGESAPKVSKPVAPKKPKIRTHKKLATKSGLSMVGGVLNLKSGAENIYNGNYKEGAVQVSQGGVYLTEGALDISAARKGLSSAPTSKLAKRLKIGGGVLNGGMALLDAKRAYNAVQSGNEVKATDETANAVINAVSAFPPTAVIGLAGGVADWAMAASGIDDAMISGFNSKQNGEFSKQVEYDKELAKRLVTTSTEELSGFSRKRRKSYMRGINGLKEFRQFYNAQGKVKVVRDIDWQIARVKGAWSKK